jgi:NAD(P)-dependent dehydrogenase (short-subunit alcohol dehydrogenase family)
LSDDRVAFVTGATGSLGRVVTRALLERGMRVFATYRRKDQLEELVIYLGPLAASFSAVEADLANPEQVRTAVSKALEKHRRIDVLLNIAGGWTGGRDIAETPASDLDAMLNVNLKSAFLACSAVLPTMISQNYGKIISVAARPAVEKRYRAKNGAYAISKAGIVVLTETIAEEVKKYNINVNAIMPSTIDTAGNKKSMPDADSSKWVDPVDIAKVILHLISDDAKITNGASIPVYGKA